VLVARKVFSPNEALPGQYVNCTITLHWQTWENKSGAGSFVDVLPEHLLYDPGTLTTNIGNVDDGDPRRLRWSGAIPDGTTATITFRALVNCMSVRALSNEDYPDQIVNVATGSVENLPFAARGALKLVKPDLQISAVEVTQAIQNLTNDMRLIKEKETYVRVYPAAVYSQNGVRMPCQCGISDVSVRLTGPGGQTLDPLNTNRVEARPWNGQDLPGKHHRDNPHHSLFFRLPRPWRQQDYQLVAEINPEEARPDRVLGAQNEWQQDLVFHETKRMYIVFHMIHYEANGIDRTGVLADAKKLPAFLNVYPISDENRKIYWDGGTVHVTWPVVTNDDRIAVLAKIAEEAQWWWDDGDTTRVGVFHSAVPLGQNNLGLGFAHEPGHQAAIKQQAALGNTGRTLAHEVGHNFGLSHIPCQVGDGTGGAWARARAGYPNDCWIGQGTRDGYYGFDTRRPGINVRKPDAWSDFMGYGPAAWVSDFTYNRMYDRLKVAAGAAPAPAARGDRFSIMGTLTTTTPAGHIDSIYRSDNHTRSNTDLDGPYTLEVQTRAGDVLATDRFGISMPDPPDEKETHLAFSRMLPYHADAARIVLKEHDTVLHAVEASAHPPTVTLTAPLPGTTLTDTLTLTWTADDEDDDLLTYVVLYSADDGATWRPLGTGLSKGGLTVATDLLPGGSECLVRVGANDGFYTTWDVVDGHLVAERRGPTVDIWSPQEGDRYPTSRWLVLSGQAYDQDRAFLEGENLVWTSDREGELGTGAEVEPAALSYGGHVITLTATDGEGLSASQSVTITVGYETYLPAVSR
jgi:hypothetical protein